MSLDLSDLRAKLNSNTKLVAVGHASNSVGTINPIADICQWAHDAGSLVFIDAVHSTPHLQIDVEQIGCDFLACSAYKFFGPHVGVMWGRRELLERYEAYKVRPAPNDLPGKWMTGTQNHEGIAGAAEAVRYLADLGRELAADDQLDRRQALQAAYRAIGIYEQQLVQRLLTGLNSLNRVRVWGIVDDTMRDQRLPTVSITHDELSAEQLAGRLGDQGLFVWHGNYYALELSEVLDREPGGMVRIGLVHYNTSDEVDRLIAALTQLD